MIRTLFWLAAIALFVYLGATVNLGKRTLFGHVANIWSSDEAKELREDVDRTAAPMFDRMRKAARAGWDEYRRSADQDAGVRAVAIDGSVPAEAP